MLLLDWRRLVRRGLSRKKNLRRTRRRRSRAEWSAEALEDRTLLAAPVGVDDSYDVFHDRPLTVAANGVLGNDTDADSDPLTALLESNPANGTLVLGSDGSFTYTPNADFVGSDSFSYRANDGSESSAAATVTIDVTNTTPRGTNDAYRLSHDTTLTVAAGGVLSNDSDWEEDALTATLVSGVSAGTLALAADGSFTYTPNAGFQGTDSFTYKPNDGVIDGPAVAVTLTVADETPTARDDVFETDVKTRRSR